MAGDEGDVAAPDRPFGQLGGERLVGGNRPGDDEQAGRTAVEPVDDPGSLRVAHAGQVREAGQQTGDERPVGVTGAGVDDDAGRLVDDDDGLVGVDDAQLDVRFGLDAGRRGVGEVDGQRRAGDEGRAPGGDRDAVDRHPAIGDQLGGLASRDVGQQRDGPVDPDAVERGGDGDDHPVAGVPGPAARQ